MRYIDNHGIYCELSQNNYVIYVLSIQKAPPLLSALTSGRYHIKWTKLTDLPVSLCNPSVALQRPKVYVIGNSLVEGVKHQVYVYNINTDQWGQLPSSGHYHGIPHIIGKKLVIIGGHLSATRKRTNKVSTFDEDSQTWTSYYPDLLQVRSKPGVVSHLEHVIVAGGRLDDKTDHRSIEIFNWMENSHWRKVSIKLPIPMWGFTPTISDDHLIIVCFLCSHTIDDRNAFRIPVANITASIDQQYNSKTPTKWTEMTAADYWNATLVPGLSSPVVVGGQNGVTAGGIPTSDIKMYDNSSNSWNKIGSLSFARSSPAVAAVYSNTIIVIGGYTKGGSFANPASSSVTTVVELGQAELLH